MKQFLKKILGKEAIAVLWHLPKAVIAAFVYGFPARSLTVIGVSGTKGKTSTAYYLTGLLENAGLRTALFSTAALRVNGVESLNTLKLTTPTPFFLQKFLRDAVGKDCTHAVLEISSHAIVQRRIWGIPLHALVITNLGDDHLEYHTSGEEYRNTHTRLLKPSLKKLIINSEDSHSATLDHPGTRRIVVHQDDANEFFSRSSLIGNFNKTNLALACAAAEALGVANEVISMAAPLLRAAPGRMEVVQQNPFTIIVDYAHSPESLESFFSAVKPDVKGKIIAVFGACGERDPNARPRMGEILDASADTIIVTNDDPYGENPDSIADQLMSGIHAKGIGKNLFRILDRRDAIGHALSLAGYDDMVCILGKGAEQVQVFKNKKIPWDDRHIVRELLGEYLQSRSLPSMEPLLS